MMIFGAGEFAQVIQHHTGLSLTVHRRYVYLGLEVFEDLQPTQLLVCVGDNVARKRIVDEAVARGHTMLNWRHPDLKNLSLPHKPNTFLFEGNDFQPFSSVGENTVVWANNHIGHHSRIGNHCFITSHVCIGGSAQIGDYCFIGMNATVFDHVKIGNNCVIAAGAVVDRDIPDNHTLSRKGVLVANEVAQA